MGEFMTIEMLQTFVGLTMAVALIVQFTKSIFKDKFGDSSIRIYSLVVAMVLTFTFTGIGVGFGGIVLGVLNSILISIASNGTYELVKDPKAEKK